MRRARDFADYELHQPLRAVLVRVGVSLLVVALFHAGLVAPVPGLTLPPDTLADLVTGYPLIEIHNHLIAGGGLYIGVGVLSLGFLPHVQGDALLRMAMLLPRWKQQLEVPISGERLRRRWSWVLTLLFAVLDAVAFVVWLAADEAGIPVTLRDQVVPVLTLVAGAMATTGLLAVAERWALTPGVALLSASNVTSAYLSDLTRGLPGLGVEPLSLSLTVGLLLVLVWLTIGFYGAEGRVPIRFARQRPEPDRRYRAADSYLPLTLDHARSEAIVNAAVMLGLVASVAGLLPGVTPDLVVRIQDPNGIPGLLLMLVLLVVFSLLYSVVNLNILERAEALKMRGGFTPGVRPGREMVAYLQKKALPLAAAGVTYKALLFVAVWGLVQAGWLAGDPVLVMSTLIVLVNFIAAALRRLQAMLAMGALDGLIGHRDKRWWQWLLD